MRRNKTKFENLTEEDQYEVDLENCAREINSAKDKLEQSIIDIGQWLIIAKGLVQHGEWENWLEGNVGYTKMTASRYMKAYKLVCEVKDELSFKVQNLGGTKVIELSALKVEQVEEIVTNNDVEDISVRELKEIVKEYKKPKSKSTKSNIDVTFQEENPTASITTDIVIKTDTNKIYIDTLQLNQELHNRTNSDEDIETTFVARYNAKEITHQEFNDVIVANKLNLPIFFNEKSLEDYLDRFNNDFYSSYEQYDFEADKREDRTYYSIFARELEWEEAIKCWNDKDEDAIDWGNSNHVDNKVFQLAESYVDTSKYLCIYKDYKLKGTFLDGDLSDIKTLYVYDDDLDYNQLKALYEQLQEKMKAYDDRSNKRFEKRKREQEKRKKQEEKYRETLESWKTYYQPYSMGKYKFEDIWDDKGQVKNFKLWSEMTTFCNQQRSKQNDSWKNYDFGKMFGNNTLAIKEEDKGIYKKFYRKLAMEFHPDKIKDDGHAMQLVNDLKSSWGI